MSMFDCPHCWDVLCTCGYEYRNWSEEKLRAQIEMLNGVLAKKTAPKAKGNKA